MASKDMITVRPISPSEADEITKDASNALAKVSNFNIKTQENYITAADTLKLIKGRIKTLMEKRREITAPIDLAKSKVMDLFRSPLNNYTKAEGMVKSLMKSWDDEQDRKLREQQERLRLQAEKKEQRQKEKLEEKAKPAEAEGNAEEAEELREKKEEVAVQAPVLAPREKTDGIHYKEVWHAEVTDKTQVPIEWMIPDQKALDRHATNTKGQVPIKGVKFISERVMASRSI